MSSMYLNNALDSIKGAKDFPIYNLRFKTNTELDIIHKRIVDEVLVSELSKQQEKFRQTPNVEVDKFSFDTNDAICNSIRNLPDVKAELDEIIKTMSIVLTRSFELLKNTINPEVESLYNEIKEMTDHEMKTSVDEDGLITFSESNGKLQLVNVDGLIANVDDIQNIVTIIHNALNVTSAVPTIGTGVSYINTLSIINNSPLIRDLLIKTNSENVERFNWIANKICNPKNIYNTNEQIFVDDYINFIIIALEVIPILESLIDKTEEQYKDIVTLALNNTKNLCNASAYMLEAIMTTHPLGNSLVFSPFFINYKKFTEFENRGGTLKQLQNVVRVYFNDDPNDVFNIRKMDVFPYGIGLKFDQVIERIEQAELNIEKINAALLRDYDVNRKTQLVKSLYTVLHSYIDSFTEPVGKFNDLTEMKTYIKNNTIFNYVTLFKNSDTTNIEHLLYMFLLELKYPEHIVKTVYEKLGNKYDEMLNETNDPTSEQVLIADLSVMSNILIEFLVEELTKTV